MQMTPKRELPWTCPQTTMTATFKVAEKPFFAAQVRTVDTIGCEYFIPIPEIVMLIVDYSAVQHPVDRFSLMLRATLLAGAAYT